METKQLHSLIEKRRRIKINREFEALKYLIPACRTSKSPGEKSVNNNSKIDGMYKLTILKSSVEYIMYLHHLIQKQSELLRSSDAEFDFDNTFTKYPLNVNDYRNIDKDFSFKKLLEEANGQLSVDHNELTGLGSSSSRSSTSSGNLPITFEDTNLEFNDNEDEDSFQLPSPIITPDMPPNRFRYNSKFQLPDPALSLPQKKLFKSPPKSVVINGDIDEEINATKTLLSLRKSSIDNLLN
ncbi:hypothetical protein CANTEDRAFT_134435 [Yamadazyma tenuis ATCC 10573]|nr:uncharacterized protein CANTEDRAFT_134435 [Yamadazyma tenuis ATCC 10573]EGV63861.1 hypothetical protein CANTEDRAFT_134435 [Yamadazyma tenuis ATCC 10573]